MGRVEKKDWSAPENLSLISVKTLSSQVTHYNSAHPPALQQRKKASSLVAARESVKQLF